MPWGKAWIVDPATHKIGSQYLDIGVYSKTLPTDVFDDHIKRELPGIAIGGMRWLDGTTLRSSVHFLQDGPESPPAIECIDDVWNYFTVELKSANNTDGQWSDTSGTSLGIVVYPVIVTPQGKFAGPFRTVLATVDTGHNSFEVFIYETTKTNPLPDSWTGHLEFWVFADFYSDPSNQPTPQIFTLIDIHSIGYKYHNSDGTTPTQKVLNMPPVGPSYLDAFIEFHGDSLGSKSNAYYKQRFFWPGDPDSVEVQNELDPPKYLRYSPVTERPIAPSKIYWTDPVDLHVHRRWAWITNPTVEVGEPLTGLVGTSMGLLIFSTNSCWVFDGDFASIGGTQLQRYPTPVGHDVDAKTPPVAVGGGAVSVWNGQLWELNGGQASQVGETIFDPLDVFVGVSVDAVNGDLIAQTQSGKLYRLDIQSKAWSLIEDFGSYNEMLYDPETYGLITWKEGTSSTNGWTRATLTAPSTDEAIVRWEDLDFGAPNVWKQFRRLFLFLPGLDDPSKITVTGTLDGQPFTAAPAFFDHRGYFSVGLPSRVSNRITVEVRLASGTFADIGFRPPLEFEYRPVRVR